MDMRVAGSLVMDSKVGAHSFVYKVVLHIGTHKGKQMCIRDRPVGHRALCQRKTDKQLERVFKIGRAHV